MNFKRELKAMLAAEDCAVVAAERGGKHWKLLLSTPAGPRLLVLGKYEGDWRTLTNLRKDVRRLIREPLRHEGKS